MFQKAIPVFPAGMGDDMNRTVGFSAQCGKNAVLLRIAGASVYSVFVNGKFVFYGPARAAHGYSKTDEIPVGERMTEEKNTVTVLLSSYRCNSFSLIDKPGFLCAELLDKSGNVLAATNTGEEKDGFVCVLLPERIQKVMRYSFQRNFTEAYRLTENSMKYYTDPLHAGYEILPLEKADAGCFKPRGLFLPEFEREEPEIVLCKGHVERKTGEIPRPRSREHRPTDIFKCFSEEELTYNYLDEICALTCVCDERKTEKPEKLSFAAGQYRDLAFAGEVTGLISLQFSAEADGTELMVWFDEVYNGENVDPRRMECGNCITLFLDRGSYHFLSAEPYSLKYLRLLCIKGKANVENAGLLRVGYPAVPRRYPANDRELSRIYDAAVETFRQNTCDIFMDCPSRERAGWLCDSFFTARVEKFLTGKSEVEREFLTNFIECGENHDIPEGMLPMCYPADHTDHVFIPNWAMWFVLELAEYYGRSRDRALIDRAEEKVRALLRFFKKYENSDGLLEKLPSWIFVEWSRSNDLVNDVNFPTNMLYARMKSAVSELYGDPRPAEEAEIIRAYIRKNTMVNGFFCDNAVRGEDNRLHLSGECTETCQYYAFFCGTATPETHKALWETMVSGFGPGRKKGNRYPAIAFSNSFIGNYLRLDLLRQYGYRAQLQSEIRGYFLYMADKTGTLWENDTDFASCNHGFASYVAVLLGDKETEALS